MSSATSWRLVLQAYKCVPCNPLGRKHNERGFIWDIGLREYNSTQVDKGLDFLNFS